MTNSRSLLLVARKVAFRSFSGISWPIILYGFLINLQFWVLLSTFSPSITNNHALLLNQFYFSFGFPLVCVSDFISWLARCKVADFSRAGHLILSPSV